MRNITSFANDLLLVASMTLLIGRELLLLVGKCKFSLQRHSRENALQVPIDIGLPWIAVGFLSGEHLKQIKGSPDLEILPLLICLS